MLVNPEKAVGRRDTPTRGCATKPRHGRADPLPRLIVREIEIAEDVLMLGGAALGRRKILRLGRGKVTALLFVNTAEDEGRLRRAELRRAVIEADGRIKTRKGPQPILIGGAYTQGGLGRALLGRQEKEAQGGGG